MKKNRYLLLIVIILILASLACKAEFVSSGSKTPATPIPTPTMLPALAVQAGEANPQEPTAIFGKIPYTWPFFLEWFSEPFILLEDQAGFVERDKQFEFALAGQTLGPVTIHDDQSLTYDLALPSVPQGTLVDVDNNGEKDLGVQVFAVAYWDNTWGGLFLEERDGIGWSTAYSSTIVNPNNDDEIVGGTLVVWAPDDLQAFPTGFGSDGLLFTDDDPTGPLPAGYSIVDLNQEPFRNYKQARIQLDLIEGVVALNDYSDLSYSQAFDALFEKVSREYPFTVEKNLDWQALYNEFKPKIDSVGTSQDYYKVLHDFIMRIPDGHISISPIDPQVLYNESGGGFGLIVDQLTDGRVIATEVLSGSPAEQVGMLRGAEIIEWNGLPVEEALDQVVPGFGPASTEHALRRNQLIFLTRVPPDTQIGISFKNPEDALVQQSTLSATIEYDSLFQAMGFDEQFLLPVEGQILSPSGLGYIRVNTFSDDQHLIAQLWERYIQTFIDNDVPGVIIDLRQNSGGNGGLANDFAGFFFDREIELYKHGYYNTETGEFDYSEEPTKIKPAPILYDRPLIVLVGPDCASACEGFAYALQQNGRATILGNTPSAGMFGEVGRGQYKLPGDLSAQFPTGRPQTPDGKTVIEGTGVVPDILVPITEESLLNGEDTVLQAAIESLLEKIR